MYAMNYSANQYKANSVNTSPQQLVVMCYDGIIRFLTQARKCIEQKDIEGRVKHLNKALAVIDELQSSLDFARGGEVAKNLDRCYDYFNNQLMQVGMNDDVNTLDHVVKLVKELRYAWAKVAEDAAKAPVANQMPYGGARNTGQGVAVTG